MVQQNGAEKVSLRSSLSFLLPDRSTLCNRVESEVVHWMNYNSNDIEDLLENGIRALDRLVEQGTQYETPKMNGEKMTLLATV